MSNAVLNRSVQSTDMSSLTAVAIELQNFNVKTLLQIDKHLLDSTCVLDLFTLYLPCVIKWSDLL